MEARCGFRYARHAFHGGERGRSSVGSPWCCLFGSFPMRGDFFDQSQTIRSVIFAAITPMFARLFKSEFSASRENIPGAMLNNPNKAVPAAVCPSITGIAAGQRGAAA